MVLRGFIRLVALLVPVLLSGNLGAQTIRFRQLTNQDGLSQNTVTAMVQDSRGFLWFGTQDGLNRYDGHQFLIFKHDPADSASLASNWILSLLADRSGRIWAGTNGGGLQRLDMQSGRFQTMLGPGAAPEAARSINALAEAADGSVWAAATNGMLYRFQSGSDGQEPFARMLPGRNPLQSLRRYNDTLLVGASRGDGLQFIHSANGALVPVLAVTGAAGLVPFSRGMDIQPVDSTGLLAGTDGEGAWLFNGQGWVQISLPGDAGMKNPPIRVVGRDAKGALWLGTDGFGAFRYNPKNGAIENYGAYYTDDYALSDNSIYSMFLDRQGIFWLGTFLGGANKYDAFNNRFFTLHVSTNPERTLSNPMVRALQLMPDGKLWIGTRGGGINVYVPGRRTVFRPFGPDMMDQRINALALDSLRRVWVGTWGGGLYLMQNDRVVRHFLASGDENGLPDNRVRLIFHDSKKRTWVATGQIGQGTLSMFQPEKDRFVRIKLNRKGAEDPNLNTLNQIYEDTDGRLYLSTFGGLVRLTEGADAQYSNGFKVEYFRADDKKKGGLGHNVISSVLRTGKHGLWAATYGLGIARITEPQPGVLEFEHVTEKDGLPTNGVMGILEDSKGLLWLGTNKGIARFDPDRRTVRTYLRSDGITGNQINQGAMLGTRQGVLFFGTSNGLTLFAPETLEESRMEPDIILTGFHVFGKPRFNALDLPGRSSFELSSTENFITFEFSALDYSAPASIQYQCFMEGVDKEWNRLGSRRIVSYTNLAPGTYTFRIRSTNSDGIWSSREAVYAVRIVPPFYQTRTFFFLILAALTSAIFVWLRFRERVQQARTRELELAVDARTAELAEKTALLQEKSREAEQANLAKSQFLAGMSHELRTPLNAILGFSQILFKAQDLSVRYKEYAETMYRSGSHLLSMINDVLDISKIEAGRMELKPAPFDMPSMLRDLEAMFKLECRHKGLAFQLETAPDLPVNVLGDASKVRQILINLIGNAVKYTGAGRVDVQALDHAPLDFVPVFQTGPLPGADAVWFVVSDTGRGIEPDRIAEVFEPFRRQDEHATGTGLGLAITSELVRLMGGSVQVMSEPGRGSAFAAVLPLPAVDQKAPDAVSDLTLYTGIKGDRGWKVLIVDDIASNIELLHVMLERVGFTCLLAGDGNQGLTLYDRERPDIVLLDLRMPGMRGEEVMREIRRRPGGRDLPVIAVTASVFEGNEQSLLQDGFSGFLVKPFHQNDLFAMISRTAGVEFITEAPGAADFERQTQVERCGDWLMGLPADRRTAFTDAVLSTDHQAIAVLCRACDPMPPEAACLLEWAETSDYHAVLALADIIEVRES